MITYIIPPFVGKRWLKVGLRTLHLVGFAGLFAAMATGNQLTEYWAITITSGVALLLLEALSNLVWFVQVRALFMYLKFALLAALFAYPEYQWYCMIVMVILSGIISHAPSSLRYYSIVHRKKITSLNDIRG